MKHNLNKEPKRKKRKISSSSGFRGVRVLSSGRYQATLRVGGKRKSLGTYDTDKEAARVYDRAVLKHVNVKKKKKKKKNTVQKVKVTKSCNVGVQQKKKKEKEKKMEKKEMKKTTKKKTRVQGLMELVGHTHFHDEMFNRQ
jgi:hypothetical protein